MKNMLAVAISIAAQAFEQKLYNGKPYMLHCLRVMMRLDEHDSELMQIGVLHDLIEDCPGWSLDELRKLGFSERVLKALELLSHTDHTVSYESYIRILSYNKDAVKVKMADLEDNSNIVRQKGLRKVDFERLQKYHTAYTYLSKI